MRSPVGSELRDICKCNSVFARPWALADKEQRSLKAGDFNLSSRGFVLVSAGKARGVLVALQRPGGAACPAGTRGFQAHVVGDGERWGPSGGLIGKISKGNNPVRGQRAASSTAEDGSAQAHPPLDVSTATHKPRRKLIYVNYCKLRAFFPPRGEKALSSRAKLRSSPGKV